MKNDYKKQQQHQLHKKPLNCQLKKHETKQNIKENKNKNPKKKTQKSKKLKMSKNPEKE